MLFFFYESNANWNRSSLNQPVELTAATGPLFPSFVSGWDWFKANFRLQNPSCSDWAKTFHSRVSVLIPWMHTGRVSDETVQQATHYLGHSRQNTLTSFVQLTSCSGALAFAASVSLSVNPPVNLTVNLSVNLSTRLSTCLSTRLSSCWIIQWQCRTHDPFKLQSRVCS